MRTRRGGMLYGLGLWLLLACAFPPEVQAQRDTTSVRITQVRFPGNTFYSAEDLNVRVRTRANRRFLGIPGFTWWLWLHEAGQSLGGRFGRALEAIGEPPALLDENLLATDAERLRLSYLQEGYRDATVEVEVEPGRDPRDVQVLFRVSMGEPTYMRTIRYEGVNALTPAQKDRLAEGSALRLSPRVASTDSVLVFRGDNQRYSEPTLLDERRRLLTFLRNEGFARISRDSIQAVVNAQAPDSFDVTLRVRTGARYRFGRIDIGVTGPEVSSPARQDTLAAGALPVTVSIDQDARLRTGILRRSLQFSPGTWYDESALRETKRRLEASGLFSFTDIQPLAPGVFPDSGDAAVIPHTLTLRTRSRHRLRLNTFVLQRTSQLEESSSQVGLGIGVAYENGNLLGNGETFRISTTGSVAAADFSAPSSLQAEITASLTAPYLLAPFRRLEQVLDLFDVQTQWSLTWLTARREVLKLAIRGRGSARLRLTLQHTPRTTSFIDVLDVSLSNPDTLDGFTNTFLEGVLDRIEDPVQRAQFLEDYTRPQVNNALRYALRTAQVNPLRRDRGYSREASVEVGGNLPYLLDRFVFSRGTVDGSLPGLRGFGSDTTSSRLIYRQYLRFSADGRRYVPVGSRSVVALKLLGGVAHPLGKAQVVPFDRRFYSGGGNSVRGWSLRTLGPGRANEEAALPDRSSNVLGGDIKLEAGLEIRTTVLRNLLAADWMLAAFSDAGNVWFGPRNPGFGADVPTRLDGRFRLSTLPGDIALGGGGGLRIAWEYLIVRLDVAYRLHDPASGWWPGGPPQLHFGIGHAF